MRIYRDSDGTVVIDGEEGEIITFDMVRDAAIEHDEPQIYTFMFGDEEEEEIEEIRSEAMKIIKKRFKEERSATRDFIMDPIFKRFKLMDME